MCGGGVNACVSECVIKISSFLFQHLLLFLLGGNALNLYGVQ